MRTTKRSISSATLGQLTRWRNLDPLNLFAMRLRYQPRIVSVCAADATSSGPASKTHRLRHCRHLLLRLRIGATVEAPLAAKKCLRQAAAAPELVERFGT